MEAVIGLKVSRYASAAGVVRAVEEALMSVTDRECTYPNGERGPLIYMIQALPYTVGTYQSPWSPNYPSALAAAYICQDSAPVQIEVV